jgi:hypothetical protein
MFKNISRNIMLYRNSYEIIVNEQILKRSMRGIIIHVPRGFHTPTNYIITQAGKLTKKPCMIHKPNETIGKSNYEFNADYLPVQKNGMHTNITLCSVCIQNVNDYSIMKGYYLVS